MVFEIFIEVIIVVKMAMKILVMAVIVEIVVKKMKAVGLAFVMIAVVSFSLESFLQEKYSTILDFFLLILIQKNTQIDNQKYSRISTSDISA